MTSHPLDLKFVPEAAKLAMQAYTTERSFVPCLPEADNAVFMTDRLAHLFSCGTGVVLTDNGCLAGFMAGYPVDSFFGKLDGAYCPAYGHGAAAQEYYPRLYRAAADGWVREGLLTHAVTLYAHDKGLADYFFVQGFGLRCVDAMRFAAPITASDCAGIEYVKVSPRDCGMLMEIHRKADHQYCESPVFMPDKAMKRNEDPAAFLQDGGHEWAAFREGQPVGCMRVSRSCEHFAAEHTSVMNVGGTYVLPAERGRGIGGFLLRTVTEWMISQGFTRCSVDYESINPYAQAFWKKYFTPYTSSVVRRVDERILEYLPLSNG